WCLVHSAPVDGAGLTCGTPEPKFAELSAAFRKCIAATPRPIIKLRQRAAVFAAGPDEFERRKQLPGRVVVRNSAGDQITRHRSGVEPGAAEAAGEPQARTELADLRHAMERMSQRARPGMLNGDFAELGIGLADFRRERVRIAPGISRPGGHASVPH